MMSLAPWTPKLRKLHPIGSRSPMSVFDLRLPHLFCPLSSSSPGIAVEFNDLTMMTMEALPHFTGSFQIGNSPVMIYDNMIL